MKFNFQTVDFATRETVVRGRIDAHRSWIESEIGIPLSEAVIMYVAFPVAQIAVEKLLNYRNGHHPEAERAAHLADLVQDIAIPPTVIPSVSAELNRTDEEFEIANHLDADDRFSLDWVDCPVALRMRGIDTTFVAMSVQHRGDPTICDAQVVHLLIAQRKCLKRLLRALYDSRSRTGKSRLYAGRAHPRLIAPCSWDQLVLDPTVASLLQSDFDSFFERREWFRSMRLPFRRGYLLHGPPGNGKSTAIRAMLSSRGLSAYTLHLFDSRTDDSDLDALFSRAEQDRPAVVLLEDLDRAFPKTGQTKCNISLQQLLNSLDGVGTGEGIIVIATANEPTILDPAILRRPGRFDRVVHFPNPSAQLRREYFLRMQVFRAIDLDEVVTNSEGFSFAFLRETYIMAGQRAFEHRRDIVFTDLEFAVEVLKKSMRQSSRQPTQAGFMGMPLEGVGAGPRPE